MLTKADFTFVVVGTRTHPYVSDAHSSPGAQLEGSGMELEGPICSVSHAVLAPRLLGRI